MSSSRPRHSWTAGCRGVAKKRNRKPVSCSFCRIRKLRCDRSVPSCSNCLNRPEVSFCDYSSTVGLGQSGKKKVDSRSSISARTPPQKLEDGGRDAVDNGRRLDATAESLRSKLERLEGIIQGLVRMHNGDSKDDSKAGNTAGGNRESSMSGIDDDLRPDSISMPHSTRIPVSSGNGFVSRAGEALWSSLLSELAEVRAHVQHDPTARPPSPSLGSAPTLLFGVGCAVSREEILRQLPSRNSCDKMVASFFDTRDPALCFLHRPTFMEQYKKFWADQSTTPMAWVALLVGVLRLAVHHWIRDESEPSEWHGKCPDLAVYYRSRAVECLIHADYTQTQQHLIEALLLHMFAEYLTSRDFNSSIWVLNGVIVRMCMKMGYFHPSASAPRLSPFQVEIRRRVCAFVRMTDLVFSFQAGLPPMLYGQWAHGILPRNVTDESFGSGSEEMPLPLPISEKTEISYLIVKAKLVQGFAVALHEVEQLETIPYSRVLELDHSTRQIYRSMPAEYQVNELPELPVQNPLMLATRLVLANIFNKTLCVIHSKHLKASVSDQRYLYSRLACVEAATTLLKFQAFQHQKFSIKGRVTRLTRYQSSITVHDYFLAATMLFTALFLSIGNEDSSPVKSVGTTKEEILAVLDRSVSIFSETRHESSEARRACELFEVLLNELRNPGTERREMRQNQWMPDHLGSSETGSTTAVDYMSGSSTEADVTGLTSAYGPEVFQYPFPVGEFGLEPSMFEDEMYTNSSFLGLQLDDPLAYVRGLRFDGNI